MSAPETTPAGPPRILVADDDKVTATLLRGLLRSAGYQLEIAHDGAEAVQRFFESYPDLVILDLNMPVLSGDLVCLLLRQDDFGKRIPIILLTADEDRSSEFWARAAGADQYLPKRFDRNELLEVIRAACPAPRPEERPAAVALSIEAVLERVSRLLDRKLFLATVQRAILDLGSELTDYRDTLQGVFKLLAKVARFEAACLAIEGDAAIFLTDAEAARLIPSIQGQLGLRDPERILRLNHADAPIDGATPAREFFALRLQAHGRAFGTLALASAGDGMIGDNGRRALRAVRNAVGAVVDSAKMYDDLAERQKQIDQDLEVARAIQAQMLPDHQLPDGAGLEVFGLLEPAKGVGGDYYHWSIHDRRIWLAIGDVAGKGVAASLIVSAVHTMLGQLLAQTTINTDPLSVLEELNAHFHANFRDSGRFMSMTLMVYEPKRRQLEVAGAGHEALLRRPAESDVVERMPVGGMVLGVRPTLAQARGNRFNLRLTEGDSLLLYSDGTTEAVSLTGDMYGLERLEQVFAGCEDLGAQAQVKRIRSRIKAFTLGAEPHDDLTLVAMRAVPRWSTRQIESAQAALSVQAEAAASLDAEQS